MKRTTTILLALGATAASLLATPATPAATAATPDHTIRPAALERGPDVRGPRIVGSQVVDGARRVPVPGRYPTYVGRAGADYLVRSSDAATEVESLWRVGAATPVRLVEGVESTVFDVAPDGRTVLASDLERNQVAARLLSTTDASVLRRRTFDGSFAVADFDGREAVLSGYVTVIWNLTTGRRTTVATRLGSQTASLAGNRLALWEGDGCTRVTTLRAPLRTVWRSCSDDVVGFSPNGRRLLTVPASDDGDTRRLTLRGGRGKALASYAVARSFRQVRWETPWVFVTEARGTTWAADVRCAPAGCERAGALTRIRATPTS